MTCETIRKSNFGEILVSWGPVGAFVGLAKDSSAVDVSYREDGGDLEMAADGVYGTLMTDNDYSAAATVKLDESSPTYAALMAVYQGGKGVTGTLSIVKSNGESDIIECAYIKDMGNVVDGYRAQNFREVIFHGARRNFDGGELG